MPPKKEEKKAKPSATKVVADKVRLGPHHQSEKRTNASDPDLWHEKCEQTCQFLTLELGNTITALTFADL